MASTASCEIICLIPHIMVQTLVLSALIQLPVQLKQLVPIRAAHKSNLIKRARGWLERRHQQTPPSTLWPSWLHILSEDVALAHASTHQFLYGTSYSVCNSVFARLVVKIYIFFFVSACSAVCCVNPSHLPVFCAALVLLFPRADEVTAPSGLRIFCKKWRQNQKQTNKKIKN